MSKNENGYETEKANVDLEKREFMGKLGKYTVGAGMATLMTPTLSTAGNYACKSDDKGDED